VPPLVAPGATPVLVLVPVPVSVLPPVLGLGVAVLVALGVLVLVLPLVLVLVLPLVLVLDVLVLDVPVVVLVLVSDAAWPNHRPVPVTNATTRPPAPTRALTIRADRLPLLLGSIARSDPDGDVTTIRALAMTEQ
jgi:hypothetical protein